jgi:chromosome segregation ATPase
MYLNEPSWTCALIDDAIGILGHAEKIITSKLEEIRQTNDELRKWGRTGYDQVEEHLETISDLEKTIENLESDIQEHLDRIHELELTLMEYENE